MPYKELLYLARVLYYPGRRLSNDAALSPAQVWVGVGTFSLIYGTGILFVLRKAHFRALESDRKISCWLTLASHTLMKNVM